MDYLVLGFSVARTTEHLFLWPSLFVFFKVIEAGLLHILAFLDGAVHLYYFTARSDQRVAAADRKKHRECSEAFKFPSHDACGGAWTFSSGNIFITFLKQTSLHQGSFVSVNEQTQPDIGISSRWRAPVGESPRHHILSALVVSSMDCPFVPRAAVRPHPPENAEMT